MKIKPIDGHPNPLGEDWPSQSYRLPDQNLVTLDVASDGRLSEWSYFWLTFCTGAAHPAWYRVYEKGGQLPEWRPLKSSVKRVLKQTDVDDDDEDPADARRGRKGKVGAAKKLSPGQYLLEVKLGPGDGEHELAGIKFKVRATPPRPAPKPGEIQVSLTRPVCSAAAVVSFIKLPKLAVRGLGDVARLMSFNGGPESKPMDLYAEYLKVNGQRMAEYPWSGIVLVTLLSYLREKQQITLMKSKHDKVALTITETRKAPQFFFTDAHRQAFLAKLDGPFPEPEMRDYFREYNGVDDPEAGKKMLDGIHAIRRTLSILDKHSVVLFGIEDRA